ncbi:hypothetical protein Tco_0710310 [Tanacetum coccineum]
MVYFVDDARAVGVETAELDFCSYCASKAENSFAYDPNPNSFDNSPNFSYPPPQPQFETYSCELCGNDSHYGYDFPLRVPLVYEPEPCYNPNSSDNYYPHDSPSCSQQYLCCTYCGGPHYDYQCQPINETYYEPNPNYDSSGFDQPQPPQDSVDHQGILQALDKMKEELEEIKQDRRKKIEDMSIEEMRHEQLLGIPNDTSDVPTCDNDRINVESDLVESLINCDTSIVYSSKIDPILEEFTGELAHIAPIPPGIVEVDFDPDDDTLSNDDDFEDVEFVSLEESFHFDNPSFPCPPPEPPDVEICFDFEPDAAVTNDFDVLNNDEPFDLGEGENVVFKNVEEDDTFTLTIRTFLPFVTYPEVSPLSCSTGSEDTIFDPGIFT